MKSPDVILSIILFWITAAPQKSINYISDNNTYWSKSDNESYPDSFGCSRYALESTGNYIYPACESSSGSAGVWDQSTWDNSVFGD